MSGRDSKSGHFPITRWSAIIAVRSEEQPERERGFEAIIHSYWRPVYKSIRIKWQKSDEDAQDLTQSFFLNVMEKETFTAYDPEKGRFRTYLRTCLERFLMNEYKAAQRIKRGGDQKVFSLDYESAERELAENIQTESPFEDYFDREWVRGIFTLAVKTLEQKFNEKNKSVCFQIFNKYDLNEEEKATYDELARKFDIPVTKVTNCLTQARREFREILIEKLREVTVSEEEFNDELRALLNG